LSQELLNAENSWKRQAQRIIKHKRTVRQTII
jgi:hypothetical protein